MIVSTDVLLPSTYSQRLVRELDIWVTKLTNEDHIVPIFRFATNPNNNYPVLLSKYMPLGNLSKYLENNNDKPVDFLKLVSVLLPEFVMNVNQLH